MRQPRSEPPHVRAARRAGVEDRRVLEALATVDRHRFVPEDRRGEADDDRPVRTASGQTTSQPSLIASMLAALELTGTERVLEIGTGLGYQAALLGQLAGEVRTIERFEGLAARARANLRDGGHSNVEVHVGDGSLGAPEGAPYDAIVIAAAASEVPAPLVGQLREGGRLLAPIGPEGHQVLRLYERRDGRLVELRRMSAVRFVPLLPGREAGS